MMHAISLLTGALAGAHAATWGAYKDSIYEGFSGWKVARSIVIGAVAGGLLGPFVVAEAGLPPWLLLLFGCVYVTERGVFELYKTFLRQEDQSKYHIPMQFHVLGHVVESRGARVVAGVALALFLGVVIYVVRSIELPATIIALEVAALIGIAAGLISAIMGAWKDAPIEGFETLKFLRSPTIALAYAVMLAPLTRDLLVLGVASLGYTIASIETYKTFVDGRPPGKFAGKPIQYPALLGPRRRFLPFFAAIWLGIALTAAIAWHAEGMRWILVQLARR